MPVGQFRIVTDKDETPIEGAVTDGMTRIKLQLIVKHNNQKLNHMKTDGV